MNRVMSLQHMRCATGCGIVSMGLLGVATRQARWSRLSPAAKRGFFVRGRMYALPRPVARAAGRIETLPDAAKASVSNIGRETMEILLGVLASASFLEKVSLLVVGAALTGIIVPVVKFRMDQTRFEQQKIFEAGLAREAELVKARAQFLRDLVDPVWQFQLLALQISSTAPQRRNTRLRWRATMSSRGSI